MAFKFITMKDSKNTKIKILIGVFVIMVGVNIGGLLRNDDPSDRLNAIIINSEDAAQVNALMENWTIEFNKSIEAGMDFKEANHQASRKVLRYHTLQLDEY